MKAATFSSSAIGPAAGSLLAGNFGDGRINVLAKHGARYAHQVTGQVRDTSTGKPFTEPGLRGLLPGTAATGGTDALRFTAGINHEQNGLLGVLRRNTRTTHHTGLLRYR